MLLQVRDRHSHGGCMNLPYTHLTLAERREIYRLRSFQVPVAAIAQRLDRHPSTIYREISRNWMHDEEPLYQGYFHVAADMQARARRQRLSKLSRHPALAVHVIDCLKAAWSPEQIAGRLRRSGAPERVSHETIYRFVYGAQGQHLGLYKDLPTAPTADPLPAQAARCLHPGRQHHRAASAGDRSSHQLRSLGGRFDDVPQGAGPAQCDLARGASEPLHDFDPQSGPQLNGRHEWHDREAASPARTGPTIDHVRPRYRVCLLPVAQAEAWHGQLLLQAAGALAEGHGREHQWPGPALPVTGRRHSSALR